MDIQVFQISWQITTVEVKYQVFFDKRLALPNKDIETLYKEGLKSPKNVHKSNGFYIFVDSHFAIKINATQSSQITGKEFELRFGYFPFLSSVRSGNYFL